MSLNITEKDGDDSGGLSRRTVLKTIGLAAAGTTVGGTQYFRSTGVADANPTFEVEEVSTACWIGKQDCTDAGEGGQRTGSSSCGPIRTTR